MGRSMDGIGPVAQRIIALRQQNPCMTLEAIAQAPGVGRSRERVRQVLGRAGLQRAHYKPPPKVWLCMRCGQPCPRRNTRYCSKECKYEDAHPWVACTGCGELFRRRLSQVTAKSRRAASGAANKTPRGEARYTLDMFHSRSCYGRHIGRIVGFLAHPEFRGPPRRRKHDYDAVWAKHLETGWGAWRLARAMGIPVSAASWILRVKRRASSPLTTLVS